MIRRAVRPGAAFASPATSIGIAVVVALFLGAFVMLESADGPTQSVLVVGLVLFALTVPIAAHLARADEDPPLFWILLLAFGAKMIGAVIRITVLKDVYSGGDADRYFNAGVQFAEDSAAGAVEVGELSGTRFIEVLSGVVYRVIPDEQLAGFLVFGWFAYLGLVLFTRAFRLAVPGGDQRRYTVLVLFLPSLVFWPASLGKESWMILMLGLASYGAARLLNRRWSGLVPLGLGLWGSAAVRPHVTLIFVAALTVAWFFRPGGENRLGLGPFAKVAGIAVLALALLVVVDRSEQFFGIERLDQEGATEVLERTTEQTSKGGSEFESTRVRTPLDVPVATLSVLFRPYPWEATSSLQLLVTAESLVLIGLAFVAGRRLVRNPRPVTGLAYVVLAAGFCVAFIVAFSSLRNFGLLVRQRTQVVPFLLVLLSLAPAVAPTAGRAPDPAPAKPVKSRPRA